MAEMTNHLEDVANLKRASPGIWGAGRGKQTNHPLRAMTDDIEGGKIL